ncbi:uncharacterized protein LOC111864736 [Cryptotermes secundus]|uniref:uncharacterized protein LOC111864736 n=1 Tax=Cryptotermes secundus TaxID=105785 RepID=UPI000CD7DA48|nr:uncharacterized protein LOC111864736 [Cryptotermes secundus]XP_033607455.1 uncharacterized protein LOC111864736 [Cryptotermes secundus]
MKLFVITLFVALSTVLMVTTAAPVSNDHGNEYDYEEDAEPAPVPAAPTTGRGRLSLLSTRGQRGPSPLVGNRGAGVKQQTAAKPVEPPPEPEDLEELEGEVEEGQEDIPVTTTTEAPKKSLVRGGVRPFRSNEDLLAALKRRREQQLNGGSPKVVQVYPTPSSVQPSEDNKTTRSTSNSQQNSASNGRRRFNSKASAAAGSSAEPVVAEQSDSGRRTSGRRYPGRSKPTSLPVSETSDLEEEATPKPKSSSFRRRL